MTAHLLIVDDEEPALSMMRALLEQKRFDVTTARDGLEAMEKIQGRKPDLILLDVMMPDLDGYQLCDLLKKNPEYKNIPIIIITAKSQKKDIFWAREKGADEYLIKPVDPDALLKTIHKLLEEKKDSSKEASSPL